MRIRRAHRRALIGAGISAASAAVIGVAANGLGLNSAETFLSAVSGLILGILIFLTWEESDVREPLTVLYDLDEALNRSKNLQLHATYVRAVSANVHTKSFDEYTDEVLSSGTQVERILDPSHWLVDEYVDHFKATWNHLRGEGSTPPKYALSFAPTGSVGVLVVERRTERVGSVWVYPGPDRQVFYSEGDQPEIIETAEARFRYLKERSDCVRFVKPRFAPSDFDEDWVRNWLKSNGILGRLG